MYVTLCIKSIVAIAALSAFAAAPRLTSAQLTYLDNGTIKLGADLSMGGAITFLQDHADGRNLINSKDLGREIQQAYYSGPNTYPNGGLWNPTQAGDSYGNRSTVLSWSNDGSTLHVKTLPMLWQTNTGTGQAAECNFETWISLSGNVANVRSRLSNARSDLTQYPAYNQELPAAYPVASLNHIFAYTGTLPFTSGALTQIPNSWPPTYFRATENWAAAVDNNNFGVGIVKPGTAIFGGGAYLPGGGSGTIDDNTAYLSPLYKEILDYNIIYTYEYNLIVGTLGGIRQYAFDHRVNPRPNYVFGADRQHWSLVNAADSGPPAGAWHVDIGGRSDPQLIGPASTFLASDVPQLFIRAAYHLLNPSNNTAQLFWEVDNAGSATAGDFTGTQSYSFPVIPDGQFHTYALNLSSVAGYSGMISQLRLDPVFSGDAGDYVDIAFIASSPAAPEPGAPAAWLCLAAAGLWRRRVAPTPIASRRGGFSRS
jgi:hypothetical protein